MQMGRKVPRYLWRSRKGRVNEESGTGGAVGGLE